MIRILKYILSLLLLLILWVNPLVSQVQAIEQEEVTGTRVRGLRIGFDLASLALLYTDPGRMRYTVSVDYEAWQDIYPAIELGYQTVGLSRDNYTYNSNGFFGRFGVDVNLLKYEETDVYEMFFAGMRYGISFFSHEAGNISLPDDYFDGGTGGSVGPNQLTAHWISAVAGVRVELFKNFFMGWAVTGNIKLAQTKDVNMEPYNIPGFGKGGKRAAVVLSYTIAYRIPMQTYTPRKIIKRKPPPPQEDIPLQE